MENKKLHQLPQRGVPSAVVFHSTQAPDADAQRDLKEAIRQATDALVDAIFRGAPKFAEEESRQMICDLQEKMKQNLQTTYFEMGLFFLTRAWDSNQHRHVDVDVVVIPDVTDDDDVTEVTNDVDFKVCTKDHDTVRNTETTGGRPKIWRCLVCKAKTRYVCSHPSCQELKRRNGLLGTPLCDHTNSIQKRWKNPNNNGLTCLEIHRKNAREEQAGAMKHQPM